MFDLTLKTERLVLRPFAQEDAPLVQKFGGLREIATLVASIPHPYPDGLAEKWIGGHAPRRAAGKGVIFAITHEGKLAGSIGAEAEGREYFEVGYWLAPDYWGRGFMTEAARAVVHFAFEWLAQTRLLSGFFVGNPASGRVLEKVGFKPTHTETMFHKVRQAEIEVARLVLDRDAWAANQV